MTAVRRFLRSKPRHRREPISKHRHRRDTPIPRRRKRLETTLLVPLVAFVLAIASFAWHSAPASAATNQSLGALALNWAEAHTAGDWYAYGTDGPDTYDCSGLVSTAVLKATGIWIGRDTYDMLGTHGEGHLVQTWNPQRGTLVFFGTGHVEIDTIWPHTTFGAHDSGSQIGWLPWYSWPAGTTFWNVV